MFAGKYTLAFAESKLVPLQVAPLSLLCLILMFAGLCSGQPAGASSAPTSCSDPMVSSGLNVCFDAVSGAFFGSHRFLRRDTVKIWVCGIDTDTKYRVTVDETVIAEPDLGSILKAKSGAKPVPPCIAVARIDADAFSARTDKLTLQIQKTGDKSFTDGPGSPVTLTMGQPVFALGLGFAGTPLAKTSYQTLGASSSSSSGSSGGGSTSSGTIGYQENSASRVQPMGFLHASLLEGRGWCCSFHLSAGFTLTDNKISTNPEYLFGPSLSFLNERLFLTAGAYGGYTSALQGPYTIGGPAPSGTIPTLNQLHWKAGFAISWRVTSFGSSSKTSSVSGTDQSKNGKGK